MNSNKFIFIGKILLTNIMKLELQDNNNISKTPVLQKGVISDGNDSVGHAFITLPASEIKEANSGPVIIDSTIQQFCKENYNNGLVELEVESSIEIPENVGIYTPNDDAYELYEF